MAGCPLSIEFDLNDKNPICNQSYNHFESIFGEFAIKVISNLSRFLVDFWAVTLKKYPIGKENQLECQSFDGRRNSLSISINEHFTRT